MVFAEICAANLVQVDPERRHIINKEQFQSAIGSCMNQITHEAVDFLWAANFEQAGKEGFDGTGARSSMPRRLRAERIRAAVKPFAHGPLRSGCQGPDRKHWSAASGIIDGIIVVRRYKCY